VIAFPAGGQEAVLKILTEEELAHGMQILSIADGQIVYAWWGLKYRRKQP
jgi:hypothetical protein